MHFIAIKTALFAAITAMLIGLVNWVIDTHFITGFVSGCWLSGLFR